jgi:hypothetical protein
MSIFKRLLGRAVSANGKVQPTQKVDTIAVICDYPKFLIGIEAEELRYLVKDVLRSSDEASAYTVIRFLAGDVGCDVEKRFGTPSDRLMVISGTEAVTFSFDYPQGAEPVQFQQAVAALVSERWKFWIADYCSRLPTESA